MRNIIVLAGIVATTIGLGAVSTGSAFAMGCLSPEVQALVPVDLTHNAMGDNSQHGASSTGFGYDKAAYDAAYAKGNACPASEQSQPIAGTQLPARAAQNNN